MIDRNLSREELSAILAMHFFFLRTKLDYSLDELAAHTGVSVKTLDDIECCRDNYDALTLKKLLDFYRPFAR